MIRPPTVLGFDVLGETNDVRVICFSQHVRNPVLSQLFGFVHLPMPEILV